MPLPVLTLPRQLLLVGAALLAALLAAPAWAQPSVRPSTAPAPRPDPLDARAVVPAASYVSPLAHYRRWADGPLAAWKESNDTVARIGGWRAYARDTAAPPPVSAGAAAPALVPAPVPAPIFPAPTAPQSPASAPADRPGHHH